jgi:hypothetical protein
VIIDSDVEKLLAQFRARPRDARLALKLGGALEDEGRFEAAAAAWSLGDDVEPMLRRVKDVPNAREQDRLLSARADKAIRRHFTQLHDEAIAALERESGADLGRVRAAVWSLTHDREFVFREPRQKPVIFYMPDLPATPVTPNAELPWVTALEAAWADARREYEDAVAADITMTPYVPERMRGEKWAKLSGQLDWSSIHLYKDAAETPAAKRFPRTVEALQAVDLVRIDGVPLEAFFSRLKPGAHIPPHYGLTNTRLTVHLPIIVPGDCAIRVGDALCQWTEGEVVAFDDSYDHEAWNYSPTDRVVLIFEAHHPDLSAGERAAIELAYSVRRAWLQNRWSLLE